MRGYDAWVTREPDYGPDEPPVYRCSHCGGFLAQQPEAQRQFTTLRHCNGKAHVIDGCTHDEGVLAIIGEEYRHTTFSVAYAPECGGKTAEHHQQGDEGEIAVADAPSYEHEPHFYEEPYGSPCCEIRTCKKCGHINEEVTL